MIYVWFEEKKDERKSHEFFKTCMVACSLPTKYSFHIHRGAMNRNSNHLIKESKKRKKIVDTLHNISGISEFNSFVFLLSCY
jgi:hypothetical protein